MKSRSTEDSSRRTKHRLSRRMRLAAACTVLVAAILLGAALFYGPSLLGGALAQLSPDRIALREALNRPALAEFRSGYAARYYKPIWLKSGRPKREVRDLLARISSSGSDGLKPASYLTPVLSSALAATPSSPAQRARTELAVSSAYAGYVRDLHAPMAAADLVYSDADLVADRPAVSDLIEHLATSPRLSQAIANATRMNPFYMQYRKALVDQRARAGGDPELERLLLINLERARALPVDLGERFVLVDAASAQLFMYEKGRAVSSMKVIVGTPQEPTPAMTGLIHYAVFNPNWNVPPDLTRQTYAPRIRARPAVLRDLEMDVWSDYTIRARKLEPAGVDWSAVVRGSQAVWLRQRPGPHNAMGAVKFMLPNTLGIYLHDTPNKAMFDRTPRTFSAGCIRVEDYKRFAKWLYGRPGVGPQGNAPEQRFDLPKPVPIYITYMTAMPFAGGVAVNPDVYRRDPAVWAQLSPPAPTTAATAAPAPRPR